MKNKKEILLAIVAIIIVGMIAFGVLMILGEKKQSEPIVQNTEEKTEKETNKFIDEDGKAYEYNSKIQNILFLGIDKKGDMVSEAEGRAGGQSDCIILLSLNKETKTGTMLNISRDSMTDMEVYGKGGDYLSTDYAQITLQYAYGDGEKKSCWLTKKAVSKLLCDLPIHNYVAINIDGISTINDAMGGVTVTVPEDYTAIDPAFTAGTTLTLTGNQAEEYVRTRDITVFGSNNGRMQRQNQYLTALVGELKTKMATNSSLTKALIQAAQPFMVTDLTADEMQSLSEYDIDTTFVTLDGENKEGVTYGKEHDQFIVDKEKCEEFVKKTFYISE